MASFSFYNQVMLSSDCSYGTAPGKSTIISLHCLYLRVSPPVQHCLSLRLSLPFQHCLKAARRAFNRAWDAGRGHQEGLVRQEDVVDGLMDGDETTVGSRIRHLRLMLWRAYLGNDTASAVHFRCLRS